MNGDNNFYSKLKTDRDKTLALIFLNSLSENIFRTDVSLSNFLKRYETDPLAQIILSELPQGWQSAPDKSSVQQKILDLKHKMEVLPMISLNIAIEPTEELLDSLEAWAAANLQGKVIFDIKVNPQVLGGAVIVKNGVYKDFSLSKSLKELISSRRQEIMAQLLK